MKYIIILLLVSSSMMLNAQSFAPVGAKWTFGITAFTSAYPGTWVSVEEVVIFGKTCSLLSRSPIGWDAAIGDFSNEFICYEDSGVIYFMNYHSNRFETFIDFNADSGDSWTTVYPYFVNSSCSIKTFVYATDSISYNGHKLKRLFVHLIDSAGPRFIITERLGYTYGLDEGNIRYAAHGLYPGQLFYDYCDSAIYADAPEYYELRCYEDSVIGFVDLDTAKDCDYTWVIGVPEQSFFSIERIFPNPGNGNYTIDFKGLINYELSIYDARGNFVNSFSVSESEIFNFSIYGSNGIYFVQVLTENGYSETIKVIKTD